MLASAYPLQPRLDRTGDPALDVYQEYTAMSEGKTHDGRFEGKARDRDDDDGSFRSTRAEEETSFVRCRTDEDEAADADTWYIDADGDGQGEQGSTADLNCDQPSSYEDNDDDCDIQKALEAAIKGRASEGKALEAAEAAAPGSDRPCCSSSPPRSPFRCRSRAPGAIKARWKRC